MYFNFLVLITGNPKRIEIDPDMLWETLNIDQDDSVFIDGILHFLAQYVRKVHSDEFIHKALKVNTGRSFIDIIGPNYIAYVVSLVKNSKDMWEQEIRM